MEKIVVILVFCLTLVILAGCQPDLTDEEWSQLFENTGSCTQDSDCVLAEYSLFDCCPSICSVYAHTKDETQLMQQWRDVICIGKPNVNKNKCTGYFDFKGCPNAEENISIRCVENSCKVVITPTTTTTAAAPTTTSATITTTTTTIVSTTTTVSMPAETTTTITTTTTTIVSTTTTVSMPAETTTTITTTTTETTQTTTLHCKFLDTFQRPNGRVWGFVKNETTLCGPECIASIKNSRLLLETRQDSAVIKKWGNPKHYVRVDYRFRQLNNSGTFTSCYLQMRGGLRGIGAGIRDDKIAWIGPTEWEYNESIQNKTFYTFSLREINWSDRTVDLYVDEQYITSNLRFPDNWKATDLWWEHGDGGIFKESTCELDWIMICRPQVPT